MALPDSSNSFILYKDSVRLVERLTDEEAGQLFKAIFAYECTGKVPENLPPVVGMAFASIQIYLERAAKKWEETRKKRAEAGRAGGRAPRKQIEANEANDSFVKQDEAQVSCAKQTEANEAVSVSVSGSESVSVTDSPLPPLNQGGDDESASPGKDGGADSSAAAQESSIPPCPAEKLRELWNSVCVSLSPVRGINGKRAAALRARWAEHPDLDWWKDYFGRIAESSFLTGHNNRNWSCGFDWCLNADRMDRILEGRYDDKREAAYDDHRYDREYWERLPE